MKIPREWFRKSISKTFKNINILSKVISSKNIKVSVIMIDGSFRENTFGAEYFTNQNFPENEYEVIWVEYYSRAKEILYNNEHLKIVTLNHSDATVYHASLCFNEGIKRASGELLIIPDADVIVEPDFIQKAWNIHQGYDKLVAYGYRYNEVIGKELNSFDFEELKEKCIVTNPINYGGCLIVRKKWIMSINGYDEHETFESGFHANGLDMYTRFRNFGMAVEWVPSLKLFHPMHAFTSEKAPEYNIQRKLIKWRSVNLEFLPFKGIDLNLNTKEDFPMKQKKVSSKYSQNRRNGFFQKLNKILFFLKE